MSMFSRLGGFLMDRLGLERVVHFVARHPVPPETASRRGWYYVLGVATLAAFLVQVATGVALATKYIPSPAHAYDSLLFITNEAWLGWLLRSVHYVGASAMVVLLGAHMVRVFLTGSYKFPREMNWVLGVLLLVLTMTMALTGQLLRWDQDGIWTVAVASQFLVRVPLIGEHLARFFIAGDTVGGATLSRFFVLHVLILPAMLIAVIGVHVYLVLHHGISEAPRPGQSVARKTYRQWYKRYTDDSGFRYWPDSAWREVVAGLVVVVTVVVIALIVGPKGPGDPPDPTVLTADPRPDWYLRWYYALLWVKPRGYETFVMVYLPLLIGLGLILLPFLFPDGERSPRRRPWAVLSVVILVTTIGVLTELGLRAPWAMAFEEEPVTMEEAALGPGPAFSGARIFHARGCQFCHAVAGRGGSYGPDLTDVTRRLPPEFIAERTLRGIGNMPAYRNVLTSEEMALIIEYLRSQEHR
jgi:ubiquinol-cytochrome c reductase cytochrome b subunit